MTDIEQKNKIHLLLKHIAADSVLDERMSSGNFSNWKFSEFKKIEFNEYITKGLFERLLKDGIATGISNHTVRIDHEKAKTAFYMNTYLPPASLIDKQNEVIHKVLNEMYVRFKLMKAFNIEWFIRKEYPTNLDYLSEPDRIVEIMVREGLITTSETTGIDSLTDFGKQIAESKDGWLGYVKKRDSVEEKPPTILIKHEKQWYDTPLKIVALIEGVVIIVCSIIALNMQSNSKRLEQEKEQLSETLKKRSQELRGLEGLLRKKDSVIQILSKSDTTKH